MKSPQQILVQLTLEEKAALVIGATAWTTTAVKRLGLPSVFMADGPHGVRRLADTGSLAVEGLPATCFPSASCLGATWNRELVRDVGEAIGAEARSLQVDVLLAPGVNMKRSPLCGRNFEYYAEDPFLAGELAAAFIAGVQSRGVGTSLKHFAANNQEFERFTSNAVIDERTLREIYLAAFEIAVRKAGPWTVMGAYNRLNGERACESGRLLTGILRGEWGFDGVVVSDWGAVQDRAASLAAGLDLEMPGPREDHSRALVAAVRSGALDEGLLDRSVLRLLKLAAAAVAAGEKGGSVDTDAHHALARRAAGEGFVLLKNDGLLPLAAPRRVAVIGRSAVEPYIRGGGSSYVTTARCDVPLAEIRKKAAARGGAPAEDVTWCAGEQTGPEDGEALIQEACRNARAAEVALLFIALGEYVESESYDRSDLNLSAHQIALIRAVCAAQPRTAVILGNGGVIEVSDWIDAPAAVLETWMTGQAGGAAIADTLWGDINPSGKLAETVPLKLADTPAFLNFPGESGEVRYGEGLFIGYRYYDKKRMSVSFPFGFGLSYTTFSYGRLEFSSSNFLDSDGLTVAFEVANTGGRAGRETAQVYVRDRQSTLVRPVKELKGFVKTSLKPGERKTLSVFLDFRAFAFYHPVYGRWITEDGEFDILVGASSADIRLSGTVTLRSSLVLPSLLTRESSVRLWRNDPRGRTAVEPVLERIKAELVGRPEREGGGTRGMDMLGFIMETPLARLLNLWGNKIGLDADTTTDDLLRQVGAAAAAPPAGPPARHKKKSVKRTGVRKPAPGMSSRAGGGPIKKHSGRMNVKKKKKRGSDSPPAGTPVGRRR